MLVLFLCFLSFSDKNFFFFFYKINTISYWTICTTIIYLLNSNEMIIVLIADFLFKIFIYLSFVSYDIVQYWFLE